MKWMLDSDVLMYLSCTVLCAWFVQLIGSLCVQRLYAIQYNRNTCILTAIITNTITYNELHYGFTDS